MRWATIPTLARESVKATPAIHAAFPLLAVSTTPRHAGLVCLDARLRPIVARTRRLRSCATIEESVAVVVAELEREIASRSPAVLVVDAEGHAQNARVVHAVTDAVVAQGIAAGLRIVRSSLRDASLRITGCASVRTAAVALLDRYPPLAERLAPDGRSRVRDQDLWREVRPLAGAFCLAHAAALDFLCGHRAVGIEGSPRSQP